MAMVEWIDTSLSWLHAKADSSPHGRVDLPERQTELSDLGALDHAHASLRRQGVIFGSNRGLYA